MKAKASHGEAAAYAGAKYATGYVTAWGIGLVCATGVGCFAIAVGGGVVAAELLGNQLLKAIRGPKGPKPPDRSGDYRECGGVHMCKVVGGSP